MNTLSISDTNVRRYKYPVFLIIRFETDKVCVFTVNLLAWNFNKELRGIGEGGGGEGEGDGEEGG